MLVGFSEQELKSWKQDMHGYEKQKRTKKPFGKQFQLQANIVKSQEIRSQQRDFNPLLQTYIESKREAEAQEKQKNQQLSSMNRYYKYGGRKMRDFDIITLHGNTQQHQNKFKLRQPIRNLYNPINNQPLPQFYYENRPIILPHQSNFKNIKPKPREFNIVTGDYHEHNQMRRSQQIDQKYKLIYQKERQTRNFNIVAGKYYDDAKQEAYKQELAKKQLEQAEGQKYNSRFPSSYLSREPVTLDRTKPLSQSLIALDTKRENSKQRYKLKYYIQKQYDTRNLQHEQKREAMLRNRVHNSHSIDNKIKQLSLLQLHDYPRSTRKQASQILPNPERMAFRKSLDYQSIRQKIKSGGFV